MGIWEARRGAVLTAFEPSCPGGVSAWNPGAGPKLDLTEPLPRGVAELQGCLWLRVSLHQPQWGVWTQGTWWLFLFCCSELPSSRLLLCSPSSCPLPASPRLKTVTDGRSLYLLTLFLVVLGLCCCVGSSLVVASWGCSSLQCMGFSLQWFLLLRSAGSRARSLQ